MSLSARRAWIEIATSLLVYLALIVALRKESVDRNRRHEDGSLRLDTVALRKESVDRNALAVLAGPFWPVALRKESVDRKDFPIVPTELTTLVNVALRKESVDRKHHAPGF